MARYLFNYESPYHKKDENNLSEKYVAGATGMPIIDNDDMAFNSLTEALGVSPTSRSIINHLNAPSLD